MMTRREVICLLGSVLVAPWFTPAQIGLNFSIAPTASGAYSQTSRTLSVSADSQRWDLQGQAKAAEYQGRKCGHSSNRNRCLNQSQTARRDLTLKLRDQIRREMTPARRSPSCEIGPESSSAS